MVMRINKHDTNGIKPLLGKGELGYDDYDVGGDFGRVYVGTGSENIPLAKKSEIDSHVNRIDNPHSVTKTQVGLGNVDNTSDVNKPISTATQTALNLKAPLVSPTLVTPNIGVATGTSFNNITGLSATTPLMNGTAAVGTSVTVARADHVHPTDTSRAPLVSPAFTETPTVNGVAFSGYSGFKNYIINGAFNVNQYQRGAQSNWSSTNNCYIDRFQVVNSSNVSYNGAINTNIPGAGLYNHLSITKTAGADTYIAQRWEIPKDKAKQFLNGRILTFSCWVLTATADFIEHLLFIKNGSSANAYEVNGFSITKNTVANVWTRITGTITNIQWTYEAGDYIEIRVDLVNGLAGELHTTGWQLEEGSVATPFEQRPYGLELSLCQRYYMPFMYMGGAQSYASSIQFSFPLFRTMRVTPTLTNTASGQGSGAMISTYGSNAATTYIAANSATASWNGAVTISVSGNVDGGVASISIKGTASAEL